MNQSSDMMRNEGRKINHKRVERIWREEGLKLPAKQIKQRRLWLNDGSCIRLRPEHKNHGCPEYLRSDNGSEFTVKKFRKWPQNIGVITTYIKPGSPWENGYCESFNARMRDEFLNGEIFGNIFEVEVLTKRWVEYYNSIRPHSSLGGRPPAPQTFVPRTA